MSQSSPGFGNPLPQAGDLIAGKYRIEKMLGKGGMGAVFAAQHEILFQKVAIKVLLNEISGLPEAVARFLNEARAAARIQSEHVARVIDVGNENGMPYMVMEYLEGDDLGRILETRGPMPAQEVVDCVLEALEAIAQAHAMQIVHRDLKPANLFLCRRQDGRAVVKVLDFGISKANNPLGAASGGMTSTKAMLGSPFYMSPEQLRSSKSVDARTDIWSMGVIMYELLTGVVPYNGENLGELFAAILEQAPPPVRLKRPDVSPELEAVVLHCLQRQPDQRLPSARDLAIALSRFASPRGLQAAERIRLSTMNAPGAPMGPAAAAPVAMASGPMVQSNPGMLGVGPTTNPSNPGVPPRPGQPTGAGTAAAWGNTGNENVAGVPKKNGAALAVIAAIGLLMGAVVVVAVLKVRGGTKSVADAPPTASMAVPSAAPTQTLATNAVTPPPPAAADPAPVAPDAAAPLAVAPPPASRKPSGGHASPAPPPNPPAKPTALGSAPASPPAPPPVAPPPAPPPKKSDMPGGGRD